MIIVSACLAGIYCRYDGNTTPSAQVIRLVAEGKAIPVCPEQLGGLTTPRLPAEVVGNRVVRKDGMDVTAEFQHGAEQSLAIAQLVGAKIAILKSLSPSCGSGLTYDGTFSDRLVPGDGIFAKLCKERGIEVKTEEDFQ
jgi:uncharacterized protein YbbK (DUF523 family)